MNTDEKILQALETLQTDVKGLKNDMSDVKQGQVALAVEQKELREDIKTVDLKVEASHAFTKKAHAETMEILLDIDEINYHALKKDIADLKKRMEQLEGKRQN